jgi:hypothetical protein
MCLYLLWSTFLTWTIKFRVVAENLGTVTYSPYPWFHITVVDLGMYYMWIWGHYCMEEF